MSSAAVSSSDGGGTSAPSAEKEKEKEKEKKRENRKKKEKEKSKDKESADAGGKATAAEMKVVVRLLPPSMTRDEFLAAVEPMPPHDYFYFVSADLSLEPHAYSRAYINILPSGDEDGGEVNEYEEVHRFRDRFDGYVFVDSKSGDEYPAMVEFAPYQRVPKVKAPPAADEKRRDPKMATIEDDPEYVKFKEALENPEKPQGNPAEQLLEEIEARERARAAETQSTPLLDFIKEKKAEKARLRQEKRDAKKRKEEERSKNKKQGSNKEGKAKEEAGGKGDEVVTKVFTASKSKGKDGKAGKKEKKEKKGMQTSS